MRGINKTILIGHVGKDPEMRHLPSGTAIANFTMATSESRTDKQTGEKVQKTEWHRVVAFGKLAGIIGEYVKKGTQIYIEGKLSTSSYDKDGQKHYSTQVVAEVMQMLGGKPGDKPGDYAKASGSSGTERQPGEDFDDSIPF